MSEQSMETVLQQIKNINKGVWIIKKNRNSSTENYSNWNENLTRGLNSRSVQAE